MAKQKKEEVETSSATLDAGTRIHGPKEVVARITGSGGSGSTSSTSGTRKTSDK